MSTPRDHDVAIYKNGWCSPHSFRGKEEVGTGMKFTDRIEASFWCSSKGLSFVYAEETEELGEK